jgi:hypothetical protein
MWQTSLAALILTLAWACSAIADKADVEIGMLTCTLGDPGEVPTGDASFGRQSRDALCIFKLKNGTEETYAGKVQGVSISVEQKGALIWVVKSVAGAAVGPGLLEQTYGRDRPHETSRSRTADDW